MHFCQCMRNETLGNFVCVGTTRLAIVELCQFKGDKHRFLFCESSLHWQGNFAYFLASWFWRKIVQQLLEIELLRKRTHYSGMLVDDCMCPCKCPLCASILQFYFFFCVFIFLCPCKPLCASILQSFFFVCFFLCPCKCPLCASILQV